MNGVLPSLGGVALFLAAGLGLAELVPAVRTLPWPRRLAWAYLLGIAGLAGALYALSHFLDLPLRRPAILGTAAALVLIGLAARGLRRWQGRGLMRTASHQGLKPLASREKPTPEGGGAGASSPRGRFFRGRQGFQPLVGESSSVFQPAAAALLALICLGLLADAVTDPVTGWDGRMTWSTQALWILDEGTVDSEVLRRKNLYVTHPQYPLLLPVAQVVVLETFAVPQDVHAYRALYTTCFAAFLLLLWDGGRRWAGRLPTLLAGLAAAGVPALTFFEDSGAASGYSDLPLGCFYGAGLLLLLRGRRSFADGLRNGWGAGLLLAGAALTKNEGAVLAFFALGAAALPEVLIGKNFPRPRKFLRRALRLAAAAVPVLLALALLSSWRDGIPNRQDERYDVLLGTEEIWPGLVSRTPGLASLALREMFRFDHWTLFWIAVPVVFWVGRRGWRGRRRALALALAAGAAAPLAIAWGAYSIHPHPDTLVPVTWSRFLVQGSLPLFLLLGLALRDVLRKSPPWRASRKGNPDRESPSLSRGSSSCLKDGWTTTMTNRAAPQLEPWPAEGTTMPPTENAFPREWLRTTLDSLRDAVVALDSTGRILLLNQSAEGLLGIDLSLAAGRAAGDLLRLRDAETGLTIDLPPADDPSTAGGVQAPLHAILLSTRSGSERPVDVTFEPLLDEGTVSGSVVVLRDAAPRLAAERAFRESQQSAQSRMDEELRRRAEEIAAADRRKDQFLAMLAHELRNPLAPIRNAVELMRQVETMDPSFQPSREMVERQVKNLARLVDDLLDVSRITQGSIRLRKEIVDLKTILERAVDATRSLVESRAHELTLDLPREPVRLEADPTRLEQVVANLLNNAAKYTMPGGSIVLSALLEGKEAVIRVRDNGIGVPPDVLGRVFEPFVQSDGSLARTEGGLGIGLTLVRSLVEMHGGRVEANSPGLGQGSEFSVRLPVRVPQTTEAAAPAEEPVLRPLARPVHILVVEDNVDAAESLATLLRVWGHDVQVVHDGLEAIDAAREHRPEVVLLDIGLPGLDGYQVARRLREDVGLDTSLLVAMTGYGQPEDRRRSREAGIHHHFVKPVEPMVLRNLLADVAAPPGSGH